MSRVGFKEKWISIIHILKFKELNSGYAVQKRQTEDKGLVTCIASGLPATNLSPLLTYNLWAAWWPCVKAAIVVEEEFAASRKVISEQHSSYITKSLSKIPEASTQRQQGLISLKYTALRLNAVKYLSTLTYQKVH